MKKNLLFLLLILSTSIFGQSNFSNGFSDGYKKGFCHNQGIGCMSPLPPIAPIPKIGENLNSYQDGYNRGFEEGLNSQKTSNKNNNSTRERFTAQSVELSKDNIYNSNANSNLIDLKYKVIEKIVFETVQHLEAKEYDDALYGAKRLIELEPNFSLAYVFKSSAQFHKGEVLNAYNNAKKGYNLDNSKVAKDNYDFMYKKMTEFLSQNMKNSYFSQVQETCEAFWDKNNLSNYYLGLSFYYQGDYKKAKKYLKKVDDFEPAEKFLESIENNTIIPNPYLNFKKETTENTQLNNTQSKREQTDSVENELNELNEITNLFKTKNYEEIIERLKPFENKIDRGVINDKNNIFRIYGSLTYCYYYTKNFEQTVKYSTKTINNSQIKEIGELYFMRSLSKANINDYYGSNSDLDYLIENFDQINYKGNSLATLYNNKAYNLVKLKNYKEAKPLVEKAITLDNSINYIWDTKGEIEYNLGNYNECEKAMTNSINIADSDNSYFYRGLAKIKLGKKSEGCSDLSKAGELGEKSAYDEIKKYCN